MISAIVERMSSPAVLLFARLPRAGRVKTRLARTVGDEVAVAFYRACAEHLFDQVRAVEAARYVFVAEPSDLDEVRAWVGPAFVVRPQRGDDLGARMRCAFEDVFADGAGRAVVTATDTPELSRGRVLEALEALERAELVVGPSGDGGYYLLGMRRVLPWLFEHMPWSTPAVLPETRRRADTRQVLRFELGSLEDVDTETDLRAWLARAHDPLAARVRGLLSAAG
jgi:rSAM/selenodomain-associated transferase 1